MTVLKPVMTATAEAVLAVKAQRYKALEAWYPQAVPVTLTLRLPHPLRHQPLWRFWFSVVASQLETLYAVTPCESSYTVAGDYECFLFEEDPFKVKEKMMFFEQHHPLGDYLDLDVMTVHGPVKRTAFNVPLRRCTVCDDAALVCMREERHTLEDIAKVANTQALQALDTLLVEAVCETLTAEVRLTPKGGLVCEADPGCHTDMDATHFKASIQALRPFFKEFLTVPKDTDRPAHLKAIGLEAEAAMVKATGGVNTHKGVIFLFGWLLPFVKDALRDGTSLEEALERMSEAAYPRLKEELSGIHQPTTAGEKAYHHMGLQGIRGEVMHGLPSLRRLGLWDAYDDHQRLCALMSVCDDTTVLKRHNFQTLRALQGEAKALMDDWRWRDYQAFSDRQKAAGISCGGCADLWSVWTFLREVHRLSLLS